MKWTRLVTTEIRVTPWRAFGHYGYARVRIWVQTDGLRWWQCHEWEREGGNGERCSDRWIPACPAWPVHAADPQPGEDIPPDCPPAPRG